EHPALLDLVTEVERSGIVPPAHDAGFTGYTHTPQQLRDGVVSAGLELRSLVGLEGIAFALCDVEERMNDPAERLLLLDTLRAVEAVPDLLGLGPHLLATATRTSA